MLYDRQISKSAELEAALRKESAARVDAERRGQETETELGRMRGKVEERMQNPMEQEIVTLKALLSRAEVMLSLRFCFLH